jgi:hypothetical protein
MSYLDRLKQLEQTEKIFQFAPQPVPTKPTKAPFVSFVSSPTGENEKNFPLQAEEQTGQEQTATTPIPDETTTGNHWRITLQTGRVIEVCQTPPQTRAWVLANWQATDAERLPDIHQIKDV